MPERIPIGRGATALPLNTLIRQGEGYGWLSGGGVSRGSSTSQLDLLVNDGKIRAGGELVEFSSVTVTLPDADPQNPRRDLIYVDYLGTVSVVQGEAASAKYSDAAKFGNPVPSPPSGANINGVPLAEVWVDSGIDGAAELGVEDINDARVADVGARSLIPELSADPPEEDLIQTRLWRNTTAGEFRAYVRDTDSIVSFTTSTVTSFSGPTTRMVEDFDNPLSSNWSIDGPGFDSAAPFEGTSATYWDSNDFIRAASDPGDGLPYYPQPGDTIGMAFRFDSGDSYGPEHIRLGFADDTGGFEGSYEIEINEGNDELRLVETVSQTTGRTIMDSTPWTRTEDVWYMMEVEFDGGGEGVHPCRVYSTTTATDPGQRDSVLAELPSPPADTTHRGRGLNLRLKGRIRVDYLHVLDD